MLSTAVVGTERVSSGSGMYSAGRAPSTPRSHRAPKRSMENIVAEIKNYDAEEIRKPFRRDSPLAVR